MRDSQSSHCDIILKSHLELILLGGEKHAVVLILEHRARILTVGCRQVLLLVDKGKSHLLDDCPHRAVRGLNAVFPALVGEVVEQGAKVDPDTALLQHSVDHLDELQDVVGAVDEEAGDHRILSKKVLGLRVYLDKIASGHRELGILRKLARVNIGEVDGSQLVLALDIVAVVVQIGVDFEAINGRGFVEDKVAGEEHKQTELIALAFKSLCSDLEGKSTEASAGNKHFLIHPSSSIRIEGGECLDNWGVALLSFH